MLRSINRRAICRHTVHLLFGFSALLLAYHAVRNWERTNLGRLLRYTEKEPEPNITFGLPMDSNRLIDIVRKKMVYPHILPTPYSLRRPSAEYFSRGNQDRVVARIFRQMEKGYFIEAGAGQGERYSNTLYLERELEWTGLLVEPSLYDFDVLVDKNRKSKALNACLSPTDKSQQLLFKDGFLVDLEIRTTPAPVVNALSENETASETTLDPHITTVTTQTPEVIPPVMVECFPLFTVLFALGNPTVDYLSLDVNGAEYKVLSSMAWHRVSIRLISVELSLAPEGPDAIRRLLENNGFSYFVTVQTDGFFYHRSQLADGMTLSQL